MHKRLVPYGLAAGMLIGLGLSGAKAAPTRLMSLEALGLGSATMPAAMCGFSCRSGGRYIPGPPEVCFARGLNYCGPSGNWGGPPRGRGYYGEGPHGGGPGPVGSGRDRGGRGPDERETFGRGPALSEGRTGRRGQAPQGNPYGWGSGRCDKPGLCRPCDKPGLC
jgi:hypothetical protein